MKILTLLILFIINALPTVNAQKIYTLHHDATPFKLNFTPILNKPQLLSPQVITQKTIINQQKKNPRYFTPRREEIQVKTKTIGLNEFRNIKKEKASFVGKKTLNINKLASPKFLFKDNSRLNIKYADKQHGFFSSSITDVVEDKDGNMWISSYTDGVCKLSSSQMLVYNATSGLPSNSINFITLDSENRLWIGTDNGVCYLKKDSIFTLSSFYFDTRCLAVDNAKNIWIGTLNNGVFKISGKNIENYTQSNFISGNCVNAMCVDKAGNVWLGTENYSIVKYDGKSFSQYVLNLTGSETTCNMIIQNSQGIWFDFFNQPLVILHNERFEFFHFRQGNKVRVFDVVENATGIWIADYRSGMYFYNVVDNQVSKFDIYDGSDSSMPYRLCGDRFNNVWVTTLFSGIYRVDELLFSENNPETEIPITNVAAAALKDNDNNTWYLPNGNILTKEDSLYYTTFVNQGDDSNPALKFVWDAEFVGKDEAWLATYNSGICKMDKSNFTFYKFDKGNITLDVLALTPHEIWFTSMDNGAIQLINNRFYHYDKSVGLLANQISVMHCDQQRNVWLATSHNGINILNNNKIAYFTTQNGLSDEQINYLYRDDKQRVWISTEKGIDIIDKHQIFRINTSNGLPSNMIRTIAQDSKGNFWITSNTLLSKLTFVSPNQFTIENYDNNYGLNLNNIISSILGLDNEKMLFTSLSGIISYDPLFKNPKPTNAVLSLSYSDSLQTNIDENKPLKIAPNIPLSIDITSNYWGLENNIEYSYAMIRYRGDTNWINLGHEHQISIHDMLHGKYTLLIQAKVLNNNTIEKKINIEILPYWYQTILFKFSILLLSLIIIFSIFYINKKRAKAIQNYLQKEIEKKTKELLEENKIKDSLLNEVHHRVKNNLQTISSLLYLQIDSAQTAEAKQALVDTNLRLNLMALVHEMLYSNENIVSISVGDYIKELIFIINEMVNNDKLPIHFELNIQNVELSINQIISLGMITNEVISNSIKYAFRNVENPTIEINFVEKDSYLIYEIKDNGCGLKKNQKLEREKSIGIRLIDIFSRQLKATLSFKTDNGVTVCLQFSK